MTGKMESVTCYPCHIYGIGDPKEADKMNDITRIPQLRPSKYKGILV